MENVWHAAAAIVKCHHDLVRCALRRGMCVAVCGIPVSQLLPSGVRKAKQKCSCDSRYHASEPESLVQVERCSSSDCSSSQQNVTEIGQCIDSKAGGQTFLSTVFVFSLSDCSCQQFCWQMHCSQSKTPFKGILPVLHGW